jgi:hypothetical protein
MNAGARSDREDPKALVAEAYRIEGIGPAECRSIFMDWALSLPEDVDAADALPVLLERHGARAPDHPMTAVLREGLRGARRADDRPARRGGWRARRREGGNG